MPSTRTKIVFFDRCGFDFKIKDPCMDVTVVDVGTLGKRRERCGSQRRRGWLSSLVSVWSDRVALCPNRRMRFAGESSFVAARAKSSLPREALFLFKTKDSGHAILAKMETLGIMSSHFMWGSAKPKDAMVSAITTTKLTTTLRMTLMIRLYLLLTIRRGPVLCPVILTTECWWAE